MKYKGQNHETKLSKLLPGYQAEDHRILTKLLTIS